MNEFIISCESTIDMPYEYAMKRNVPILFYSYSIDGVDYVDDMLRDPKALPSFYEKIEKGKLPTTSQLNVYNYIEFFEEQLKYGNILHITLGTGMTKSYQNAVTAAEELMMKYPDKKIIVIDSLCSSSGYGMLVDYALDMHDNGVTMEEIEEWVLLNRKKIHHQFFSTELKHYRRSGRMSGSMAMIATILNICPIMHLNAEGKIIAYSKVRGKKKAIKTTVDIMMEHCENGKEYNGKCFICHSKCLEDAHALQSTLYETFPNIKDIKIFDIGTIIASHCGPGTVAVFFLGDERV